MNILKIVENSDTLESRYHSDSCISMDHKMLCLSDHTLSHEQEYDEYFDKLDQEEHIYDLVLTLIIETDHIHRIPDNVKKFKNLKNLIVQGSRFWDLDMIPVPESVCTLKLIEHTNLQECCILGMEKLLCLTELYLDMKAFAFSLIFEYSSLYRGSNTQVNDLIPIPDLPKLKLISFHTGISYRQEDLKLYWKKIFKNNLLLSKIKHRITKIILDDSGSFPVIQVILNEQNVNNSNI